MMNRRVADGRGHPRVFGERGAAAVEAAIVTPVVLALFFGIMELGFLFKDYLSVASAVRAGVRIASASPRSPTFAQDAADKVAQTGGAMNFNDVQQLWIYKVDSVTDKPIGFFDFSNCTTCVKFTWDNATHAFDPLTGGGNPTWSYTAQNACSESESGKPRDRIGVYLQLKHYAFTKFVFKSVNISDSSILALEPIPTLTGCS